jgi:hypothetical protein
VREHPVQVPIVARSLSSVYWFTVNETAGFDRNRDMAMLVVVFKRPAFSRLRGGLGVFAARPQVCDPVRPRWTAPGRA